MTILTAATPQRERQQLDAWLPPWWGIVTVAAILGGLSLLVLPDGIAYDPWSWLVWGREVLHLGLDTRNAATSVKPLPMAITTVLALFGKAAPDLWLVVARAGALVGVGAAWRLATRLGGPLAGPLAALGVATSYEFASYLFFTGMSEPMATATALAAADCAVAGRHRKAFGLILLTSLLRLEAWPFALAYAAWRVWCTPSLRRLVVAGLALGMLPVAWFGTDWLGSRQFLRSASAASRESQGGPLLSAHPGLAVMTESVHLLAAPLSIGFVATTVVAIAWRRRGSRWTALGGVGLTALAWLAVAAAMAQARVATGALRYLLPAGGLAAVVGACGIAIALDWLWRGISGKANAAWLAPWLAALVVLAGFVPDSIEVATRVHGEDNAATQLGHLQRGLHEAVRLAGGLAVLQRCGPVSTTTPIELSALAWQSGLAPEQVVVTPAATGTIFFRIGSPPLPPELTRGYRVVGTVGLPGASWTVLSTCPSVGAGGF